MNFKKILTIYRKELLDLMRDRRTVITSFVLPVLLYPLLMIGLSSMMMRQEVKLEEREITVYIQDEVGDDNTQIIREEIESMTNLNVMQELPSFNLETFRNLIDENSVQAAVVITDSVSSAGYSVYNVKIYYNQANEQSQLTYNKLKSKLNELEKLFVSQRLSELRIDAEILRVVDVTEENVAPPEKMLGFMVGKFLPYMLIILTISGAAVVATDLVAGEKERGTLETILVSAARRNELVIGKYLTIITFSVITVLLNLFSMYISFQYVMGQAVRDITQLQLPLGNFALILVLMLPLVTFFAAVLLSISTYSRNSKESQSYQMPLMFGAMILSMVSFLPGFELNYGFALIPVVNFSLLFRNIMLGDFLIGHLIVALISTLILDFMAIYLSIRLFNNEAVLFRTADEESLKFWGKEKKNVFSLQFIFLFFIAISMMLLFIGGKWQAQELMGGLVKTQLLIILLPTILVLRISGSSLKQTLRLNSTKPMNFIMVALMSVPILILVTLIGQLINIIFPISESYLKTMQELMTVKSGNLWQMLLVIAVLPGICEETMFRGYIINGFKKQGFWGAILLSGLLFGIMHWDPFRLLPTTILGIWMGYLLLKTNSLFIPMLAHFLNNGLVIVMSNFYTYIPGAAKFVRGDEFSFWLAIPAILILYLLINIFNKLNQEGLAYNE